MSKRKINEDDLQNEIATNAVHFLVSPLEPAVFFKDFWEQKAHVVRATEARRDEFQNWFTWSRLEELVRSQEQDGSQLEFGVDVNAARYKNGKRETLNGDVVDIETIARLKKEGCTLQVHQPQRWVKPIQEFVCGLETQLGCLVGSNAYLTPKGTQGLAPHYDDVELWVCQTEGSKRWRVYNSKEGYELPFASSKDFEEKDIGKPVMDVVLEVGDVLYLPRGTIHQAVAQDKSSCHLTISTYQKWTIADYAQTLIQELQNGIPESAENKATPILPREMRSGLPVGFLYEAGLQAQSRSVGTNKEIGSQVRKDTAKALRSLADKIEQEENWTALVADRMAVDFLQSRMAPETGGEFSGKSHPPEISDSVFSVGRPYFRIVPCYPAEEVREAYPGQREFVMVLSCLKNRPEGHMMGGSAPAFISMQEDQVDEAPQLTLNGTGKRKHQSLAEEEDLDSDEEDDEDDSENSDEDLSGDLVFPKSYTKALIQLLEAEDPIPVRDIKLSSKEEKVGLAYSLWDEGLISTDIQHKPKPVKRVKL